MHPDVGAIIGISLAGSVLAVAIIMLCILHVPWPCCKNVLNLRPVSLRAANGNRRAAVRPSTTSSQAPFANRLSVVELHNQNQAHIYSATGIVNPVWQMRCSCHPGMMTASQQSLNFAHCHPINSCQFQHPHVPQHSVNIADNAATEVSSFQYFSPQLVSPSESPPPYPGLNFNIENGVPSAPSQDVSSQSVVNTSPPPYSPKR